jgi:hypothetical protein
LILLAKNGVAPEAIPEVKHAFDLTMASEANVGLMGSYAINIAAIKMVACGQITSSGVAELTHDGVSAGFVQVRRNFNEKVNLGLGRKPWNSGASDMVNGNKLSAERRLDLLFGAEKEGRPSAVIEGYRAGQPHGGSSLNPQAGIGVAQAQKNRLNWPVFLDLKVGRTVQLLLFGAPRETRTPTPFENGF